MPLRHVPINTPLGQLHGRDCIFLDEVFFDTSDSILTLVGDINGPLIRPPHSEEWVAYDLIFHGVVWHRQGPLDGSGWDWEASFEERPGSPLLAKLDPDGSLGLHHYFVQTYDDTFDVICKRHELILGAPDGLEVPVPERSFGRQ